MKIQNKITFWISGTVVFSTLIFSSLVFFEMLEIPFLLIDKELNKMARALVLEMERIGKDRGTYDLSQMAFSTDNYWIKVTKHRGEILYRSMISRYTDILPAKKSTYMVEKTIPRDQIWL